MEYKILESSDKDQLVKTVMRFIKEGWSIEGGVSIAHDGDYMTYAQAMILYGEVED
jgi:hypothetical protein